MTTWGPAAAPVARPQDEEPWLHTGGVRGGGR